MIKVTIIGDIVCDKEMLKHSLENNKYCFDKYFSPLKDYFKDSDYVVGNLETIISNIDYTNSTFSFCNPEELIISLKKIGVNALSLANNHILDRKEEGIISTINILNKHDIKYFGISNHLNINIKGNKIVILGYTDSTNYHINKYKLNSNSKYKINILYKEKLNRKRKSIYYKLSPDIRISIKHILHRSIKPIVDNRKYSDISIKKIENTISNLKKQNKYVIMYPHIGGQYNLFLGEYTKKFIETINKFGCDSIVITHPHIIQDVKNINNCFSIGDIVISPKSKFVIWNTLPEYSIVLNYYFENNNLIKITLSFLICIKDKKTYLKVYPFYDFYNELAKKDKEKYSKKFKVVFNRVFDCEFSIKDEYIVWE